MTLHRWNKHSYAHRMVANLQVEMANALYEEMAKKNAVYKHFPNRKAFVNAVAPTLRDCARATLANLLNAVGTTEAEKSEIYQALILDATLPNEDRFEVGQPKPVILQ